MTPFIQAHERPELPAWSRAPATFATDDLAALMCLSSEGSENSECNECAPQALFGAAGSWL